VPGQVRPGTGAAALEVVLVSGNGRGAEHFFVLKLVMLGEGSARGADLARPIGYSALTEIAASNWQLGNRDGKTIAG